MNEKNEFLNVATFSHEIVAMEEVKIGFFFSALAIQYLLQPKCLKIKNIFPQYLNKHANMTTYAAQRVFIKKILDMKEFKDVRDEFEFFLVQYSMNQDRTPDKLFLDGINKSFLIRQIFKKTDQILPKYNFIENYIGLPLRDFNWQEFAKDLSTLPVEQKILVLSRLFDLTGDNVNRNKTIIGSFIENAKKIKEDLEKKNKQDTQEYDNVMLFLEFENKYGFI